VRIPLCFIRATLHALVRFGERAKAYAGLGVNAPTGSTDLYIPTNDRNFFLKSSRQETTNSQNSWTRRTIESPKRVPDRQTGRPSFLIGQRVSDKTLDELKLFMGDLKTQTKSLIATSRVLTKESRPLFSLIISPFLKKHYSRVLKTKLENELRRLDTEIKTIAKKDRERIDSILKKKKDS